MYYLLRCTNTVLAHLARYLQRVRACAVVKSAANQRLPLPFKSFTALRAQEAQA